MNAPGPLPFPADGHAPAGHRLGSFELRGVASRNSLGIVYRAWDHELGIAVAIKEYLPQYIARRDTQGQLQPQGSVASGAFERGREAFVEETRLLARCDHPSLLRVRQLLLDIRREHPHASVPVILRTLVADGRMEKGAASATTLRRFFAEAGLDRIGLRDGQRGKTRLRWQAERPMALWHGDVCYGPSLRIEGRVRPLRIHALMDDASRYVVALEAHHSEREVDMLGLFVRALRRHGKPDALYLDNGSTYRGETLATACAPIVVLKLA